MHEKAFITSSQSGDILAARSYDPSFFAAVPAAENTKPDGTTVGYQQPFRRVSVSYTHMTLPTIA